MKNLKSLLSSFFIIFILLGFRLFYSDINSGKELNILNWDALGYYIYLPGTFIYEDLTDLAWYPEIEKKYGASGGGFFYQGHKQASGKYVFKYLGGVAIMQTPFFGLAHLYAKITSQEADGFSKPYQYGIALGAVFYAVISIFLFRKLLLKFFRDEVVAFTMLLLFLASNFVQYSAIDGALSHAYIFPLYVLILYATCQWHLRPSRKWAALIGLVIGLSMICRPTEFIMIFIPIFWDMHNKEATKNKWDLVTKNYSHLLIAAIFGLIGILPQLIYWELATGHFIYNVGSKWSFLSPFFRVLFGWEKGWFIYTPVTIMFVAGLFFMKNFPFKKSVIVFCILNIYIIISWFHWRYGASYSTRALVQSYPVFGLALAGLIHYLNQFKWKYAFWILTPYLIFVNLFQTWQYSEDILHSDHMNRKFYSQIYLKPNPTALVYSLLDTDDWIGSEEDYQKQNIFQLTEERKYAKSEGNQLAVIDFKKTSESKENWLKVEAEIRGDKSIWNSFLQVNLVGDSIVKTSSLRMVRAQFKKGEFNEYGLYIKVPPNRNIRKVELDFTGKKTFEATIRKLQVSALYK